MIDRTTLPLTTPGEVIEVGRRFEVLGQNFNRWPDEIVLGYDPDALLSFNLGSYMLKLVDKTPTKLTFEAIERMTIPSQHLWNVFASPFVRPRVLLSYD